MLFSAGAFTRIAVMSTLVLRAVATGRALRRESVGQRRLADTVSPASFEYSMSIGDEVTIDKEATIGKIEPPYTVDVFFLCDTTGSMGGLIGDVQDAALDIMAELGVLLGNVAFGVGQYKDVYPDPFLYQLDQDMTTDTTAVQAGVAAWAASGGGDWPEANLFALKQVADLTSWRPDSTRILVWFGDAPGHNPSGGVDLAAATGALVAERIKVAAIDVANLDYYGQATSIVAATGGDVFSGESVTSSNVVATIIGAITFLFEEYKKVELASTANPAAVQVTTSAAHVGEYSRKNNEKYAFKVTFKCLMDGTHSFEIRVLVDGGLVATEYDTIECASPSQVPTEMPPLIPTEYPTEMPPLIPTEYPTEMPPVQPNSPPDCSTAEDIKIWPNNGNMILIRHILGITDPDGDEPDTVVTSIYSDEEVGTLWGDGHTCADAIITEAGEAMVRAERFRARRGDGRVYHINFYADDGKGGTCEGQIHVCVPLTRRGTCGDGGELYDATICVIDD